MTSYRHNSAPPGSFYIHQDVEQGAVYLDFISFIVSVDVSFLSSSFSFPGVQVKVSSRPGVPADLLFLRAGEYILIGT